MATNSRNCVIDNIELTGAPVSKVSLVRIVRDEHTHPVNFARQINRAIAGKGIEAVFVDPGDTGADARGIANHIEGEKLMVVLVKGDDGEYEAVKVVGALPGTRVGTRWMEPLLR